MLLILFIQVYENLVLFALYSSYTDMKILYCLCSEY